MFLHWPVRALAADLVVTHQDELTFPDRLSCRECTLVKTGRTAPGSSDSVVVCFMLPPRCGLRRILLVGLVSVPLDEPLGL